ncbi:MAG: hypothetical protein GSR86_00160, partial [Desulfurococcales archaeon]|nr:hypothetical protein [Desulfurococcales archaeon]
MGLGEALERLWGIEGTLHGLHRRPGAVDRPGGFRVVEPRVEPPGGAGWYWYYVYRVRLDTMRTSSLLARLAGGRTAMPLGLKDACAHAYQYIA